MPEPLTLNQHKSTPLHQQIVRHIRHRIANCQLPEDGFNLWATLATEERPDLTASPKTLTRVGTRP